MVIVQVIKVSSVICGDTPPTGENRSVPLLSNASASPVPEIQVSVWDLSSGLPMLDIEIGLLMMWYPVISYRAAVAGQRVLLRRIKLLSATAVFL